MVYGPYNYYLFNVWQFIIIIWCLSIYLTEMVFLCWARPSPQEQKACINKYENFNLTKVLCQWNEIFIVRFSNLNWCLMFIIRSGEFNYDAKFRGATAKPLSCLQEDKELSKDGFLLNHARVLVGSGLETFEKGKSALQTWRCVDIFIFLEVENFN